MMREPVRRGAAASRSGPHGEDDPPGLPLSPLRGILGSRLPGFREDGPLEVTLLPGGRSNLTFRLEQDGTSWVLRRPPLGHVMPSAHDMVREHRVLTGLTRGGFPVPRPLLLCDDPAVIGAPFLVMDYVDGRVVADASDAALLTPDDAERISALLVDTLAVLHALDATACGLGDLGRPAGYLRRQVERWKRQWDLSHTRRLADLDALVGWLDREVGRLPEELPWSVVHGDYRLDNLILRQDGTGVAAVLDWEMATLGDPVLDLAVAAVYWSDGTDTLRRRLPVALDVTAAPGFWTREDVINRYGERSGRDLDHLDVCLALACFKLAVVMESVHRRTLDGFQRGSGVQRGESMADAAGALAAMGVAVTRSGLSGLGS
jgi:aminoglycoside phosphotransferase (APT) family kinase protein